MKAANIKFRTLWCHFILIFLGLHCLPKFYLWFYLQIWNFLDLFSRLCISSLGSTLYTSLYYSVHYKFSQKSIIFRFLWSNWGTLLSDWAVNLSNNNGSVPRSARCGQKPHIEQKGLELCSWIRRKPVQIPEIFYFGKPSFAQFWR